MNLKWISPERKKEKGLENFYRYMTKKTKKLLNVKSSTAKSSDSWKLANLKKLIFWRKWTKLRESDRETDMNLIQETKQMNLKWISTEIKKEPKKGRKKRVRRILQDWWPKTPRNCWMWNQQLPNYKIVSDGWKLESWIF